jgi:hypothetical protein
MILCCKIECLEEKKVLFEDKDFSVLLHILKVYDTCTANNIFAHGEVNF